MSVNQPSNTLRTPLMTSQIDVPPSESEGMYRSLGTTDSAPHAPETTGLQVVSSRFIDRNRPLGQSDGYPNRSFRGNLGNFRTRDWFHSLLYGRTWVLLCFIVLAYLAVFLGFACVYFAVGEECSMNIDSFAEAFMFAVQVHMCIGTANSDPYFDGCGGVITVITIHVMVSGILEAATFGLLYARISRGQSRARSLMFSNVAVIRYIGNAWYFMFQVADARKHQMVEAHVRMYAMRHMRTDYKHTQSVSARDADTADPVESKSNLAPMSSPKSFISLPGDPPTPQSHTDSGIPLQSTHDDQSGSVLEAVDALYGQSDECDSAHSDFLGGFLRPISLWFQSSFMRMVHPNDELGATLMLLTPQLVVHRIDMYSPLHPPLDFPDHLHPEMGPSNGSLNSLKVNNIAMTNYNFPGLHLRTADAEVGSRVQFVCQVCGEEFGSPEALERHVAFSAVDDRISGHKASLGCKECGQMMVSEAAYKHHMIFEHETPKDERPEGYERKAVSERNHTHISHKVGAKSSLEALASFERRMKTFHKDCALEIVVVLEGIVPHTSNSIQSRYSYTFHDIQYHHEFVPCVLPSVVSADGSERVLAKQRKRGHVLRRHDTASAERPTRALFTGRAVVDMDRLHQVRPCPRVNDRPVFAQSES